MVEPQESKALTFRHFHQELNNLLIERGIEGFAQSKLVRAFKEVPKEELIGYLDLLHKEDKVQKFRFKNDFIWRATTEILV